ncbi:hypothetical protein PISL3812_00690 [Talaromyces islandicus]|uniref:C6 transcription factor n=1 Tax=Talaromyces islandicus TaxID=28573 RepID=A0A0U1LJZ4_TALIS|nr:hypothetical protein PISL3812_00690 [Talaromyces islandicus]
MMNFKKLDWNESIFTGLPPIVLYEHRLHLVLKEATASIMKTVDLGSNTNSCVLNSLVDYFDQQAQAVASKETGDIYDFTLNGIRLMIRAFHFFKTASRLDNSQDFGSHFSHFQARVVVVAAICILRVCRSGLRAQVDAEIAEELFFEVVRLSRKLSVDKTDLNAMMATIFTQVWSSTQLFKFKDGSVDGLRLLLRGRLSMSLLFDCLWWWRAEFLGKTSPYLEHETGPNSGVNTPMRQEKVDISTESLRLDPESLVTSDMALYPDFWDCEELGNLDWS